jgi:hypothetical protein
MLYKSRIEKGVLYLLAIAFYASIIFGALCIGQRGPRIGCICRDGWHSSATGRGACSHHGGVDHWLYQKKGQK